MENKKSDNAVGQFAHLKVVSVNDAGAFLDWGFDKKLLVPSNEQMQAMQEGRSYIVFIYTDAKSKDVIASSKLSKFINNESADYKEGQEVDLLIAKETNLGYKTIINRIHWGIL